MALIQNIGFIDRSPDPLSLSSISKNTQALSPLNPSELATQNYVEKVLKKHHPAAIAYNLVQNGSFKKIMVDRQEAPVTLIGKAGDYFFDLCSTIKNIFHKTLNPFHNRQFLQATPDNTPSESPPEPISAEPNPNQEETKNCPRYLYDTSNNFGFIYLEPNVEIEIDCSCATSTVLASSTSLNWYWNVFDFADVKEYSFTWDGITIRFTSNNFLPNGLIENINKDMKDIINTIHQNCNPEDFKRLQIILGTTIPGGVTLITLIALAVKFRQKIFNKCCKH